MSAGVRHTDIFTPFNPHHVTDPCTVHDMYLLIYLPLVAMVTRAIFCHMPVDEWSLLPIVFTMCCSHGNHLFLYKCARK